jgi:hypothetical protein
MTNILEIVFVVTPAGYAALRNVSEPLNIELKTVLTLVDGICPVGQYIPFLLAFDPLPEKFQILERMGYLQAAGRISTQAMSVFEQSVAQKQPTSRLPRIDAQAENSGFLPLT